MAGLALSPMPSSWLVVVLLLLSGTAPPHRGLLVSLPASSSFCWFCPLLSPPSSRFSLSASCLPLTARGVWVCGYQHADELRVLQPQPLSRLEGAMLSWA